MVADRITRLEECLLRTIEIMRSAYSATARQVELGKIAVIMADMNDAKKEE